MALSKLSWCGPAGVRQLVSKGVAGKKLLKPKVRKMAAACAIESLGLSERRACLLLGVSPSVYRYQPKQGDDDVLRRRMRELAGGFRLILAYRNLDGSVCFRRTAYLALVAPYARSKRNPSV